ncbi:hypothetical protein ABZS81_28610 [Streptomyces sp. NPDC005318]|uniref:hypothetical protein n=1 Tax=Streptomyces sp. NPDC005318 TaxID=3157031 RepID=UPI0033AE4B4B
MCRESASSVRSHAAAIELSDDLIERERAAWAEQQENGLTVETAARVQAAITAHAEETEENRYDVEMESKRVVRHPAADDNS